MADDDDWAAAVTEQENVSKKVSDFERCFYIFDTFEGCQNQPEVMKSHVLIYPSLPS